MTSEQMLNGELWTPVRVWKDGSIGSPSRDPWQQAYESLDDALGIARQLYGEDGAAFSSLGNFAQ